MLQFSFSTNGFVTKSDWSCVEMPVTVFLENGIPHTPVGMCHLIPIQELFSKTINNNNLANKDEKHNLWVYKNINHHIHIMVFQDYHKRNNGTYQIPAQTDCVAATTATVWETVTWNALMSDMNLLSPSVNCIK